MEQSLTKSKQIEPQNALRMYDTSESSIIPVASSNEHRALFKLEKKQDTKKRKYANSNVKYICGVATVVNENVTLYSNSKYTTVEKMVLRLLFGYYLQIQGHEEQGRNTVAFTIEQYMNTRGLKDKKKAVKNLSKYLKRLNELAIEFKLSKKARQDYIRRGYNDFVEEGGSQILDRWYRTHKGTYVVTFTNFGCDFINSAHISHQPKALYQLDPVREKVAYGIGSVIYDFYEMNHINHPERENWMTFETLWENCGELPSKEDVKKRGGGLYKSVVEPTERAFEQLTQDGILADCGILDENGDVYDSRKQGNITYNKLSKFKIFFRITNRDVIELADRKARQVQKHRQANRAKKSKR